MQPAEVGTLCFNRFFPQVHYCYSLALEQLKLHSLHTRVHHYNALLLIQVYLSSKFWPSVLETVGLQVPVRYIKGSVSFMSAPQVKIIHLLDALQLLSCWLGC
jgi:hypothetical protein